MNIAIGKLYESGFDEILAIINAELKDINEPLEL